MGKQKQQVISRFFAPKPKTLSDPNPVTQNPSPLLGDPIPNPNPPTPPPKIATTVSFSPAKRKLLSAHLVPSSSSTPKKPKLSPHTNNAIPSLPNPSLHEKFLQKLLEPSFPASDPPISLSLNSQKLTPLEQQVVELKKKYPDVLLMIEVGYKFRFFGEDAEIAAKVLGIYAHIDHSFLTASVPTFRLNVHVRRLVGAGYKVGVVKQTETAAIKAHGSNRGGPFTRGLSALYTKATLEAAEDVGGKEEGCGGENNYLVSVVDKSADLSVSVSGGVDVRIGIVGVEISTGDVVYGEFEDGILRSGLEGVLLSLAPAELLLGDPLSKQTEKMLTSYAGPASNVRVEHASLDFFCEGGALAEVMSLYENDGNDNLANNGKQLVEVLENRSHCPTVEEVMKMPDLAVQALALAIRHFKQFGFERILYDSASFRPLSSRTDMTLSANALQQLEVLRNNSDGGETGSLLQIMNHTLTIYGSRLLRHWVAHPLCDINMIYARLDAVSEIAESMCSYKGSHHAVEIESEGSHTIRTQQELYSVLLSVLTALGRQTDLQRGITRIFHRTATPHDFVKVIQAILSAGKQLQRLQLDEYKDKNFQARIVQSSLLKKLILTASSSNLLADAAKLLSSLNREAADKGDLLNLLNISNGQFSEVASAQRAVHLAKEKLESLIFLFRKRLGIYNLEFTSVSGTTHLIEVPLDFKVPLNWVKVNSTKKTIRYHSPEVIAGLDQLTLASEELTISCRAAWDSFLRKFGEYYAEFQAAVQALAALDCLLSLAILSRNKNYVRPEFVGDHDPVQIQIHSGRHPVLETILQDSFVPNDTALHQDREHCQIITGPNMGGKSCYIRQVALICLMAQVGSFVPASSAKVHVLDSIYTRMGASDNIQLGRSTFLEELNEASEILQNCTANSLVVLDELGRGTSTHDGLAVAYATLHYLLEKKRCMVLFVTHYPKVADIRAEFPGSVEAYHVSYLTSQDQNAVMDSSNPEEVTYLYKLVPGISARSFGFKVAQLAQLPQACISQAVLMASRLELTENSRVRSKSGKNHDVHLSAIRSDEEQEATDHESENPSNLFSERLELEEFTVSFRDLLLVLKSAVCDDNLSKCCQLLKASQRTARHVLNRAALIPESKRCQKLDHMV